MEKKTLHLFFYVLISLMMQFTTTRMAKIIPVKVGVVLDMDGRGEMTFNCISMALSDFYAANDHYKTRLLLINRDSKDDVVGAAAAALDLLKNVKVQAIIGPMFSAQASFLISLGDRAQVPIITFSASSPSLSSLRSPYFVQATLDDSSQVEAIGAIIQAFGWREVVTVYEDTEFGEGIIPFLADALENVNVRVPYRSVISPVATNDQIVKELYKLMTMQTRVFIVHMMEHLASRLFTKAKELGMMSKEYVWIITKDLNSKDTSVIEHMRGVIGIRPYVPETNELYSFSMRYKERVQKNNSLSNDLNILGLWAYDSAIALAMAAEKAIIRNRVYQETNISTNSTDLENFGVSDNGPNLIQALSRTTFKGLAGNFQLADRKLKRPPYQIVNRVSPRAQVIGYWTKENGIVKELNFTSAKTINSYSTSKSNLGSIVWPGGQSYPPKGWEIPTNGKKLRVGVPVKAGFTEFVRVTWNSDNSTKKEGYCIDVFDAVMAALPYGVRYEYIPFATRDHSATGDYNDLVYQVHNGKFDAVAGDISIVQNRSTYVDFTLPYTESGVAMVVPIKDDNSRNTWVFLTPLTWELWLTSFCSFIFIGVLIWILEHRINEDFRGPFWYQVGVIFWFAFSTMVFAQKERVISNLSRLVLIIWFLVALILTQSYTASLASMLTVQKLQPTVRDVNVLIKNKEYVGYMKGSFVYGLLKNMNFNESRLVEYNSPEKLDELLSKGSRNGGISAALHEVPYIKLFLGKYCSKYMMVEPTFKANGFGFAFPKGSPLVADVSRAILNMTEGQQMAKIERKWFGENTKCPDSDTLSSPRSLGLQSFWGLFSIVGIVGAAAFVIHVFRFLHENWSVLESSDPESTIRSKITGLIQKFDNKDLSAHTFKNHIPSERKDGCCGDCMFRDIHSPYGNNQQSPYDFSMASPHTDSPPSPVLSSPSDNTLNLQGDQRFPAENARTSQQCESPQMINQEIQLPNINQNIQMI